ncbi:MAG: antA/AntB antirepressor family protein, partial [Fusobacteriaceae bacterium]
MELIKINKNEKGEQIVSARDLHEFLEVKKDFSDWIKTYVNEDDYGFELNIDYTTFKGNSTKSVPRPRIEYILTTQMAKELCMLSKVEKGKQARKYFIECETKLNNISSESQQQRLYERSPQELLADNAIALNKMFNVLGLN